jgi:hypothetical protein
MVWDIAIRTAMVEESFSINDIAEDESIAVSKRTVRDTMGTMADLGWLEKQKPNGNQWQRGTLMAEDEGLATQEEREDAKTIDNIDQTSELEKGEVYVGIVDKASSNAIIRLDESTGSHINLGPIDESAAGEKVRFRYLHGVWGKCLKTEYTYDGYDPEKDGSSSSTRVSSNGSSFSKTTATTTGDGTITDNDPDNKNKLLKGNL